MWALPALMALALLPTMKDMPSGVCLSFPVAGTASIIRAVKTVQSLTIATEWRINMSKKCVCGNDNMNVTDVARAIFTHRNTVLYHLNKVKQQTGLDPRRFYDLVELVKMAQEVLENGS